MTSTRTSTYTKTDIRKVFECFHADLSMLAQRTGTMCKSEVDNIAHDVLIFAEYKCLSVVHIQLRDSGGNLINAHEYKPNERMYRNSARPGGNSWPHDPTGNLAVILSYSDGEIVEQIKKLLRITWSPTNFSTDYSRMKTLEPRQYASNGYGLERITYARW